MEKIDFVVPWVDGNDPLWREEKEKYSENASNGNDPERFREWDQLKYWFRGVEKHAPWVNRIHFITCGHLPSWLNVDHPKLHIVRHEDYIPHEWLPTFSANPIELNMHRIEGLSEQFVYFNDDFFLIDDVEPTDFFVDGIPCSTAGLRSIGQVRPEFAGILNNDFTLINRNFSAPDVLKRHWALFLSPRYGLKRNLQTLLLLPRCRASFPGFYNAHAPNAFLRSVIEEVWEAESETLRETCSHRFRSPTDVNQYVFLWWQWCRGMVHPINIRKLHTYLTVLLPDEAIVDTLRNRKTPIVTVNDTWVEDFDKKKAVINAAFDSILGEKSAYEL